MSSIPRISRPLFSKNLAFSPSSLETSVINNGLKVATVSIPGLDTFTGALLVKGAAACEKESETGTAHFLEHMFFKGTSRRSLSQLEHHVENLGAHLSAFTTREYSCYFAKTLAKDYAEGTSIVLDIVRSSSLEEPLILKERQTIMREAQEVDSDPTEVLLDLAHKVHFAGSALSRPVLGSLRNIASMTRPKLLDFLSRVYTPDNMVFVGCGDISHQDIRLAVEKEPFGFRREVNNVSHSGKLESCGGGRLECIYASHVVRESIQRSHFVAVLPGRSWSSRELPLMFLLDSVVGLLLSAQKRTLSGMSSLETASCSLACYNDTGMLAISGCGPTHLVGNSLEFVRNSISRLLGSVTESELSAVKRRTKAKLLSTLDGTTPLALEVGRSIVSGGPSVVDFAQLFEQIDMLRKKDLVDAFTEMVRDNSVSLVCMHEVDEKKILPEDGDYCTVLPSSMRVFPMTVARSNDVTIPDLTTHFKP